jgi:hypothetical protein
MPDPWDSAPIAARRAHRQIVNFGVAAVARISDEAPDRMLDLRCECGAAECRERVRLTRSEYEALAEASLLVVAPAHAPDEAAAADGPPA